VKNLTSRQEAGGVGQLLRAVKQAALGPLTPGEVEVVRQCEEGAGRARGSRDVRCVCHCACGMQCCLLL
jgi:hypothetical protein